MFVSIPLRDVVNSQKSSHFMQPSEAEIAAAITSLVRRDAKISEAQREANISSLDALIRRQERFISNMVQRRQSSATFDCETGVSRVYHNVICQIRNWVSDVSDTAFDFQLTEFRKTLSTTQQIRDYVVNTPYTLAECDGLESATRKRVTNDPRYQKMRRDRIRLLAKATDIIENHVQTAALALLQHEVLVAIGNYDPIISYSRPGAFDVLLEEYIHATPDLAALVLPAATVVSEGTPMALLSTLSELNLAVMNCLKINSESARAVVYTALVRLLFAVGYTLKPDELSGTRDVNVSFLVACEKFASQTVKELVLAPAIAKNFTLGLPVASLFKSKQVNLLKPMEMMTNPIDLLHYVHQILGTLATGFAAGEQFLAFDDTLTILLALLSLSPPVNAIAITAFVTKWNDVQLSSVMSVARNYFIAAVEQIVAFGET
jgi:hypothetical protein